MIGMACLTSTFGFIIDVVVAIVVVVTVAAVVIALSWHRIDTARGEMDNSIYNRVIMLLPGQETSWNSPPFFWMLEIIEAIQTAENCRARRCKHMCSPLTGFPGSLGPLGLGQQWGKREEDTGAALARWGWGSGGGRRTIFTSHLAGALVGAQQGRLVGFVVSGHAPHPLHLGLAQRGVQQPEIVVARLVLSACVWVGLHVCLLVRTLFVGLRAALAWSA